LGRKVCRCRSRNRKLQTPRAAAAMNLQPACRQAASACAMVRRLCPARAAVPQACDAHARVVPAHAHVCICACRHCAAASGKMAAGRVAAAGCTPPLEAAYLP